MPVTREPEPVALSAAKPFYPATGERSKDARASVLPIGGVPEQSTYPGARFARCRRRLPIQRQERRNFITIEARQKEKCRKEHAKLSAPHDWFNAARRRIV